MSAENNVQNAAVLEQHESVRDLDPNVLQRRASNPESSIWVSASAGTGKTKVLTDRVLRLLLPREDRLPGTKPDKILGLTFTKAGANEMALRISETLGHWAVMADDALDEVLKKLLGRVAREDEKSTARRLFADVIDTPGRLKIMTIHSFCQSVLSRFPLEAKLTPGFRLIEGREANELLNDAKMRVIERAREDKTTPLYAALHHIGGTITEDQFNALLRSISAERGQLKRLLTRYFSVDGLYTELCKLMDIQAGVNADEMLREACTDESFDFDGLRLTLRVLADSNAKADLEKVDALHDYLVADAAERPRLYNAYQLLFLRKDGEPRAKLLSKPVERQSPETLACLKAEQERVYTLNSRLKAAKNAALTLDILILAAEILDNYAAVKAVHNVLDYEDLIFKTKELLQANSQWVQFKLDDGLEHILIDEAQDTNPEQWEIIEGLCAEFFASHSAAEKDRSIFTVGDEKQSIYSFQRASPEEFARMQSHFADKIQKAQQNWNKVDLNISFRSVKSVLAAVDAAFSDPEVAQGLGLDPISHHAFRRGQAGLVELWPLVEDDEAEAVSTWDPPIEIIDHKSGASKLADQIAQHIKGWIDNREILPSHGRSIEVGDIMILVRTRNAFTHQLIRALKLQNIPVGGLDRMILNQELVVQDLLAAAQFALLPVDDLTLACLLKSPLIGMNEEQLFDIAHDRGGYLVDAVYQHDKEIAAYLGALQRDATRLPPYEFFARILQTQCPNREQSGLQAIKGRLGDDALDAIDELLNAALNFEREHNGDLQHFLLWQSKGEGDIKREAENAGNVVRIMTVHGSKGLQAPIVFLPDTVTVAQLRPSQPGNRFLWPSASGLDVPIWAPRKDFETPFYNVGKDTVISRMDEEYRRLLYVAMTRAEDWLYVAGYKPKRDAPEMCWYNIVKRGLLAHPEYEEDDAGVIRLQNPQTKEPDRAPKTQERVAHEIAVPDWLHRPAPEEPKPPAPLVPSRPSEAEPAALSPLQSDDQYRFKRGNLTHVLLQFLPDIAADKREDAARHYLAQNGQDVSDDIRESILNETLAVLNDAQFARVFGPDSRAEVPITGLLPDGRLISGQIDRLLITADEILIIDYKTNRPPPLDARDVPAVYRKQMQAYADVLCAIYPKRAVKCALLWTDGPNLMPLDVDAG